MRIVQAVCSIETANFFGNEYLEIKQGQSAKVLEVSPSGKMLKVKLIDGERKGVVVAVFADDFELAHDVGQEIRKHIGFAAKRFEFGMAQVRYGGRDYVAT